MRKGSSKRKPRRRISVLVVVLVLCNLFQSAALAYNYVVLSYQRDLIRYLFSQAFEKNQ